MNATTSNYLAPAWGYFPETRSGWRVTTVGERPYLEPAAGPVAG